MSTVAEQLRAARESQHLTLQQMADATKIRADHLQALENGDFSVFSAPIYIRGSVRNYALRLKLDLPPLMAALDAELRLTEKFSEPPPLSEVTRTPLDHVMFWLAKLNVKALMAAGGILAVAMVVIIAVAVWKHHRKSNPLGNLPPARYEPANPGDTLPLPKH